MKRIRIGLAMAALVATPLFAHDFWIQPTRFVLPVPGAVPVRMFVGHGPARDRWGVPPSRVVQFRAIGPDGIFDLKPSLTLDGPQFDATVRLDKAGSYVLALQSSPLPSDLPALRFDNYVAEEGLTAIARHRSQTGAGRRNGRELYSRRAKAIVQVGPVDPASVARVIRPVGLSLEIIPELHPLTLKRGEALPVRVMFNRKSLAGALVKLNDLDSDAKPLVAVRTDRSGRALLAIPKRGSWQLNVVWSEVTPGNPTADYRTTFSSLTFGN
jgi:uncharacterized GH25 family protein